MGSGRSISAWIAGALLAACGGTSSNSLLGGGNERDAGSVCATGHERCACYGNDTCNNGLTCASGLCVRLGSPKPPDAGADTADGSAVSGAGGRPAGGGPANGGKRASGGSLIGMGGIVGKGGTTPGSGGALTGGAPSGGVPSGGSGGAVFPCNEGEKICGNVCAQPSPRVGCGTTGCDPCTLVAPMNGYVTCMLGQCVIDCLSGYTKVDDKCVNATSGAGGNGGNGGNGGSCVAASCPDCGAVFGPGCCTSAGKCGCPLLPFTSTSCT